MRRLVVSLFVLSLLGCSSSNSSDNDAAPTDSNTQDGLQDLVTDVEETDQRVPTDIVPDETPELLDLTADETTTPDLTPDVEEDETAPVDKGPLPFSEGPYGIKPFDTADDFVLPTLEGDWSFADNWTGGNDSYIFLFWANGNQYIEQIWNSDPKWLFKKSPLNVHYFFLSYEDTAEEDVTGMKERVDATLLELGESSVNHWTPRIHYVTHPAHQMGNWLSDVVMSTGYFSLAIDRFQQLRETGLLSDVAGGGYGNMKYLRYAAEYFNYEWDRDRRLQEENESGDFTLVTIMEDEFFANDQFFDVTLPDAETMETFDTLEIDFTMGCDTVYDDSCGEWDYLSYLFLCHPDDPEVCDIEVGRWITTYHRHGHWVTDISSLLPLFRKGGEFRFRMNNSWQSYRDDMVFRLSNQDKGSTPTVIHTLWTQGGTFNADYSQSHAPIGIDIPETVDKVEIVAYITGHGFAWDYANCAEFCNHQHQFTINGGSYMKEHPYAGTSTGCAEEVGMGVVPNQFGTWPLGRGGWCPGYDVKPWIADITDSVQKGTQNIIAYEGLYNGEPYVPQELPDNDGATPGNIRISSYLVLWGAPQPEPQTFAYGEITGTCGDLSSQLSSQSPSLFINTYQFDTMEDFDSSHLTTGALERYNSENAGGSSMCSEVMSIQVLEECEGAQLHKTETEVVYAETGAMTDYIAIINGQKVGVSVTRAYQGPFDDEYTEQDATTLLTEKLQGIQESTANVSEEDQWVKQILHVWTLHPDWATTVQTAWDALDAEVKADTIVLITVESNSEFIVPDNCGLE